MPTIQSQKLFFDLWQQLRKKSGLPAVLSGDFPPWLAVALLTSPGPSGQRPLFQAVENGGNWHVQLFGGHFSTPKWFGVDVWKPKTFKTRQQKQQKTTSAPSCWSSSRPSMLPQLLRTSRCSTCDVGIRLFLQRVDIPTGRVSKIVSKFASFCLNKFTKLPCSHHQAKGSHVLLTANRFLCGALLPHLLGNP